MYKLKRHKKNPLISPNKKKSWQASGTFNGCPANFKDKTHILFRALSEEKEYKGNRMKISTIEKAESKDGVNFKRSKKFIEPKYIWDAYGCEDPRVTKIDDTFYITYTALSIYPFKPEGIRIGVATSKDLKTIDERNLATTFNSKAMGLFSDRIKGKLGAILTVHTDRPPAKIALATFDNKEQIWSPEYWKNWEQRLNEKVIPLLRNSKDHLEVGAAPLKTEYGWLLIYSYIKDYFTPNPKFGIEAALLDLKNPMKIRGRTKEPILTPEKKYEKIGEVQNIVFPSGTLKEKDTLSVYYGAADTYCCLAQGSIKKLVKSMKKERKFWSFPFKKTGKNNEGFKRFKNNPLLKPRPEFGWESKAVFNPAAVYLEGRTHLVYRAMSHDNTSVLGYAQSKDGIHIDKRSSLPIYTPREDFEKKKSPGNSGCEDPRITRIGNELLVTYTAFDGENPTRVALSKIKVEDFLNQRWNKWSTPELISPPGIDDKNSCIIKDNTNNHYVVFHRIYPCIWIDFVKDLDFSDKWIKGRAIIKPRAHKWDSRKVGIAAPPIKTKYGLLLLYHASGEDKKYRVGAMLLESENPTQIIARTEDPLLEPEKDYEIHGQVQNVVFPCGAILKNRNIFLYYGGADKIVGGAQIKLKTVLEQLKEV